MRKIIVVAKSTNRVIGKNNDLVWHLPADLAHYHRLITGGWVLMGRRTFESEYGILPIEKTIVVTTNAHYSTPNEKVVNNIHEGIEWAKSNGQERLFILGGGQIYQQAMALADEIIATEVHGIFEGDTFFPEIPLDKWQVTQKIHHLVDAQHSHAFDIIFYKRKMR